MKHAFVSWKRFCCAFTFLILSFCASGQAYKTAIGSTYTHLNELPSFRYCVVLESRVNSCNLVCRKVADTLNRELLLVAEQMLDGKEDRRKLLDVLKISAAYPKEFVCIGSLETQIGQQTSAFLIGIEEEPRRVDSNGRLASIPTKSVQIFEAWQLNCGQKRFEKFPVKGLHRVHGGYYVQEPVFKKK